MYHSQHKTTILNNTKMSFNSSRFTICFDFEQIFRDNIWICIIYASIFWWDHLVVSLSGIILSVKFASFIRCGELEMTVAWMSVKVVKNCQLYLCGWSLSVGAFLFFCGILRRSQAAASGLVLAILSVFWVPGELPWRAIPSLAINSTPLHNQWYSRVPSACLFVVSGARHFNNTSVSANQLS